MRCSVFIATSLDGFIAREDGGIDWLPAFEQGGEDYGYSAFMRTVDGLVIGRNTYELVQTFGGWPYGKRPVIVLSSRRVEIPAAIAGTTEWMADTPGVVVERLAARGMKHLYVDGGRTIQAFLAAGLITDILLTRIPVLIGQGIPLFGPLAADVKLQHTGTSTYPNGLVQSRYEIPPRGAAGAR